MSREKELLVREQISIAETAIRKIIDLGYNVIIDGKASHQIIFDFDFDGKILDIKNTIQLGIDKKQKTEYDEFMEICRTKTIQEWLTVVLETFSSKDVDFLHARIFIQKRQDIHKSLEEIFTNFLSDMTTNEKYIGYNVTDKYVSYMKIMEDLLCHQLQLGNKFHFQVPGYIGRSLRLSTNSSWSTYFCDKITPLGDVETEVGYPNPKEAVSSFITQYLNTVSTNCIEKRGDNPPLFLLITGE